MNPNNVLPDGDEINALSYIEDGFSQLKQCTCGTGVNDLLI